MSACATCDGFFFRGQRVAVVGGGNTAVEEALYLSNIAAHVTLIHRRDKLRAEKILQDRLFARAHAGKIGRASGTTRVDEVLGDDSRRATACGCARRSSESSTRDTRRHRRVHRHRPHAQHRAVRRPARRCAAATSRSRAAATAMPPPPASPGVFAAGDVADHVYRQAITSAGAGCMAALDADRYLETARRAAAPQRMPSGTTSQSGRISSQHR